MALSPLQLKEIYDVHKQRVYSTALHYTSNVEDAEEITQDVFVKVFQQYHQFQHQSALSTWIYRITINQSLDFLKKKKTKKHFFSFGTKTDHEFLYLNTPNWEHPGFKLEQKEEAMLLMDAINRLTEQQKTAFILAKLDGLSHTEIGDIMQISIPAVESLIFRAKSKLQLILEKKYSHLRKK